MATPPRAALAGLIAAGCVWLGACGSASDDPAFRIIGGVADSHAAVVAYQSDLSCTGTVVTVDGTDAWILTAAQCVSGALGSIFVGDDYAAPTDVLTVVEAIPHPAYTEFSPECDVALLRAANAPATLQAVLPMAPAEDGLVVGSNATIVGFGVTELGANSQRRSTTLPIASLSALTLGFEQDASGACFGDGGGPAIVGAGANERIAGVVSTLENADCTGTAVFMRASSVFDSFIIPAVNGWPLPDDCEPPPEPGTTGTAESTDASTDASTDDTTGADTTSADTTSADTTSGDTTSADTTSADTTSADTASGSDGAGGSGALDDGTTAPSGDDSPPATLDASGTTAEPSTDGDANPAGAGEDGCGCRSSPARGTWWLGGLVLLLRRRRRLAAHGHTSSVHTAPAMHPPA